MKKYDLRKIPKIISALFVAWLLLQSGLAHAAITATSITMDQDTSSTVTLTTTGAGIVVITARPSHGYATLSGTTLTYTPDANYTGTDALNVAQRVGRKITNITTIGITVNVVTPETARAPIPIGFWGLNDYQTPEGLEEVSYRFGTTIFQTASEGVNYTVNTLLPMVHDAGFQVTLRITGDHDQYTTDGNFDLIKWKNKVAAWSGSGVQDYIDDGTLAGHMLLDDIQNFSGRDPTGDELDEMARYSKEILPGLMTFVRAKATVVAEMTLPATGTYVSLDACVNQYTNYPGYSDGPIDTYVTEQSETAAALGLDTINGLNIADGGDGSSGQDGWGAGKYAMSAAEITTYGTALLNAPNVIMFLMWEYDGVEAWSDGTIGSSYFDQSELADALYGLSVLASE